MISSYASVRPIACPWCRRTDDLDVEKDASQRDGRWRVVCRTCDIFGPCTDSERSTYEEEHDDAVRLWNGKRSAPPVEEETLLARMERAERIARGEEE